MVDHGEFEAMMDEFYRIRGWDVASGPRIRVMLKAFDLSDVVRVLDD